MILWNRRGGGRRAAIAWKNVAVAVMAKNVQKGKWV